MPPAKILIATPTYDGSCVTDYITSVIQLRDKLKGRPDVEISRPLFVGNTYLNRARNALGAVFMQNADLTHLLFIDADMGFRPEAVERMLAFDKPFCGCIYPGRRPDAKLFHAAARAVEDPEQARSAGQTFVCSDDLVYEDVDGRVALKVERGFVKTLALGMGLALIKREVFDVLRQRHPELVTKPRNDYANMGVTDEVLQCFEPMQMPDGMFMGEDKAFCHRWRQAGGQIWACIDERLTHTGPVTAAGVVMDRFKLGLGNAPVC